MAEAHAVRPLAGRLILLGVTGGIAAYKSVFLLRLLTEAGADVQVVMTPAATRFVGPETFAALSRRPVHSDVFERTDQVLHVQLAHQADVVVVAPATANVLGKLAHGLADDLLTSVLLEATAPLVLAPAMHAGMWEHPATQANLRLLVERGAILVGPELGPLAAGDEGVGRMAEPDQILEAIVGATSTGDLAGRRILVTAGPTFEPIDAVRFVGNRSSGKMGWGVAEEAARRGAVVTLIAGPVALKDPAGVEVVRIETAKEMENAVLSRYAFVDAVVMAAAVADWRPSSAAPEKLKKEDGPPSLVLEPTTDILSTLGKKKERQVLVGFAAETRDLQSEGRRKLGEKNLDFIVVNEVGRAGTGFGSETDRAAILSRQQDDVAPRMWTKQELAAAICDRVSSLLSPRTRHI
ncbi:MAG: bifunctional phosphopantothenoylcysteine decarboxylase/phosphopantothenate--cysteine ligase CoaBC [Actinomycetota bacterium]|nr:bifunctional phosphopantothenoylcysteine decarboxylase/phosphopantothenate--cysteine ligase CoaBC [Actinomycetota bacterium]